MTAALRQEKEGKRCDGCHMMLYKMEGDMIEVAVRDRAFFFQGGFFEAVCPRCHRSKFEGVDRLRYPKGK